MWAWDSDEKNKLVLSFLCPADGKMNKVKWILTWPLIFLLFCTIPNCSKPRWESWFMFTFVLSTLWIALFSYFMVWMVSTCGKAYCAEWNVHHKTDCRSIVYLLKTYSHSVVSSVYTLYYYNISFILLFSAQMFGPFLYRAQHGAWRCQLNFQNNVGIRILLMKGNLNGSIQFTVDFLRHLQKFGCRLWYWNMLKRQMDGKNWSAVKHLK